MESKGDPLPIAPERYRCQWGESDKDVSMLWKATSAATSCSGFRFVSIPPDFKERVGFAEQGGIECQKEMCRQQLFSLSTETWDVPTP